jgi:glyceraldehyde 3-phosphate dehydrogenase
MTRIAINGFGRIGRCVLRALQNTKDHGFDVVAINDLTDAHTLGHLLKYDSVHGRFRGQVEVGEGSLTVNGDKIQIVAQPDPAKLPWADLGVDIVLECSGHFTDGDKARAHIKAGAKRVVISAPAKGNVDGTFCYGVNHESYDAAKHFVVSNASCTTNCLAPVAKVMNDAFGIEHGLMTTIHAITNDQRILDLPHSDLRRARAAGESMIPTTTGAAKAVGLVLPELKGKLNGFAMRVPTKNVSVVDLTVVMKKAVTKDAINAALSAAAAGPLKGVLAVTNEPLVSIDFNGDPASSTVDLALTEVMSETMAKVVAWYDNEWGYSNRVIDLARYMASKSA